MDIKRIRNFLYWLYWQFKIITLIYLMDPFEWWVFHSMLLVFSIVAMYYAWLVVPHRIYLVLENVLYLLNLQSESPVSTILEA